MEEKTEVVTNTSTSEDIKMSLGTAIFIAVAVATIATVGIVWISLRIRGAVI